MTDGGDDEAADAVFEEMRATQNKDRTDVTAGQSEDGQGQDEGMLVDNIASFLDEYENGDSVANLSFRDKSYAALIKALEEDENEFEELASRIFEARGLDADPSEADRAQVLRQGWRLALDEVYPELKEKIIEAKNQRDRESL